MSDVLSAEQAAEARAWQVPEVVGEQRAPQRYRTASQLEEVEQAARQEGYAHGLEEGRAEAERRLREQLVVFEQLLSTLHAPLERLDDEMYTTLVTLAHTMARSVIGRELAADPQHILNAVREAIGRLPQSDEVMRVRVHPEDAVLLRQAAALDEIERAWRLIDDPLLARGGCIVETASSLVDATLNTRLSAVLTATLGEMGGGDAP